MEAIHRVIVDFAVQRAAGGRVLDYGCGAGEVVEGLRDAGLDAVGADVFYAGNDARAQVEQRGLLGKTIFEIVDGRLPFAGATFSLIVSNQVLEHVTDLDAVLDEIARVLAPGGTFLALFPAKEVWREGHCGIPFVHRFAPSSRLRLPYMRAMRALGLGHYKDGKSREQWSRDFLAWLDAFTHYRPASVIDAAFARRFSAVRHIESDYVAWRLQQKGIPLRPPFARWICRKLSGEVIVAMK